MNGHVIIEILLRFSSMGAQSARKRSRFDVPITYVLHQARWRTTTHIAKLAFVIIDVESHVITKNSFGWIVFVAVGTLKALN